MPANDINQRREELRSLSFDDFAARLGGGSAIGSPVHKSHVAELERRKFHQRERQIRVNENLTTINKWHAIVMGVLTAALVAATACIVFV